MEEQLNSLINQTYPNFDIIAVDDCSTDGTLAILNRYAQQNPNFTVYLNDTNLGFIKNFEKGCSLATGELIALCDQDDVWDKDKLTLMADAMGEHAMVYHDSLICDEHLNNSGQKLSASANLRSRYNCLENAVFCRIYGNTILFKQQLLKALIPFPVFIPHDWFISYVATLNGGIKYLDLPLVLYRQHASNAIGAINRKNVPKSKKTKKKDEIDKIRQRIGAFYALCPNELVHEKKVLSNLKKSYSSFSLVNNTLRMKTFFKNYKILLYVKKRSLFRQYFFCLKTFFMLK